MHFYPWLLFALYALVFFAGLSLGTFAQRRIWDVGSDFLLTALALMAGFPIGLAVAGFSWKAVFWLCNCGSFYQFPSGNNHFDEDVLLAHLVTTPLLLSLLINGLTHYLGQVGANVSFYLHVVLAIAASTIIWNAFGWYPPGCQPWG